VTKGLRALAVAGGLLVVYRRGLHPWQERWGATDDEVAARLPGDGLIAEPAAQVTRAIEIAAPPEAVWPWVIQLGADRGGFYSYDRLENLFRLGIHSAREIVPRWQERAVGDLMHADAGGRNGWFVTEVQPPHALVIQMANVAEGRPLRRDERPFMEFSWALVMAEHEPARTRLLVRERVAFGNRLARLAASPVGLVSFLMTQKMMRGIKERAEASGRDSSPPRLRFACEFDSARLTELFADGAVIDDLTALGAGVMIMVSDRTPERAAVVRRLNEAGFPVVGIPLVPADEGYYFTADNWPIVNGHYDEWKAWSAEHGLRWDGVGLDIEPEARVFEQIAADPWRVPALLLPRLRDHERPGRASAAYEALVARIRDDGWEVENYQFPLIADERRVGATLLQRLLGLVDVRTDREVWMLYTSFARRLGPGILWSYGPDAEAIAVGTTGGGPDIPGHPQMPALSWQELARDLRLARRWCDHVYVHSLESCVWQGFLGRLRSFDWSGAERPATAPVAGALRGRLRGALWASAKPQTGAPAAVDRAGR
jgi:hypothetical protein